MQVARTWPEVRARSTPRTAPGHWRLRVERTLEGTRGRRGGREIRDLQGWAAVVRLRPLPRCEVPALIDMRPNRSRGPSGTGTPTTAPRGAWDEPRRPHTNVDEPWALRLLINAAVADAARQLGGSEATIEGLLDRWLERAVDEVAWATSVSARFHVARASRDGADSGRTQERKRLTSVRPTAEDAESTGAMWPFRQRPAAHKPSAWELVARVFP